MGSQVALRRNNSVHLDLRTTRQMIATGIAFNTTSTVFRRPDRSIRSGRRRLIYSHSTGVLGCPSCIPFPFKFDSNEETVVVDDHDLSNSNGVIHTSFRPIINITLLNPAIIELPTYATLDGGRAKNKRPEFRTDSTQQKQKLEVNPCLCHHPMHVRTHPTSRSTLGKSVGRQMT